MAILWIVLYIFFQREAEKAVCASNNTISLFDIFTPFRQCDEILGSESR